MVCLAIWGKGVSSSSDAHQFGLVIKFRLLLV